MPWVEALLRGQKILARAKNDGTLHDDGGRVEIRYKPQDTRAYRAAAANLKPVPGAKLLPDDFCAPGEFVARPAPGGAESPAAAASSPRGGSSKAAAPAPVKASKDDWVAYTDGACSGNPGPAGAGLVLVLPDGKVHEGYEYLGTATNNIAELTAILRALEAIPPQAPGSLIHTDSQYSIGVLSKGWKPKVNQELIAHVKKAMAARRGVRLVYVPGHAGVPLNERADELAREAIRVKKARLPFTD